LVKQVTIYVGFFCLPLNKNSIRVQTAFHGVLG